jgi:hypothetical protein
MSMSAATRVPEAMTAKMATAMMAATMPAAVPTTVTTATMSALAQSSPRQHASKRHRGNSNDRSQHRILPREAAPIEASELDGNWNRPGDRKFRDRGAAGAR